MTLLEERLTEAGTEARSKANQIDARPGSAVARRLTRRRAGFGVASLVAVAAVLGAVSLATSGAADLDIADESEWVAPTTAAQSDDASGERDVVDLTGAISSIRTSSELSVNHAAGHLIDGDLTTSWQDQSGRGEGAWIEITFAQPLALVDIQLQNLSDPIGFQRNHRINGFEISTNDLTVTIPGRLVDSQEPQRVQISSLETISLRIDVLTTYPAEVVRDLPPFDELALAEIRVFGLSPDGSAVSTEPPTDTTTTVASVPFVSPWTPSEGKWVLRDLAANALTQETPVELGPRMLAVGDFLAGELGAVPIVGSMDTYDPGPVETAVFYAIASNTIVDVHWLAWDGRGGENPLGMADRSVRTAFLSGTRWTDLGSSLTAVGYVSMSDLAVVRFLPFDGQEVAGSLDLSDQAMSELGSAIVELLVRSGE